MLILIIDLILFVLGIINLVFPVSLGLASNNVYLSFIKIVGTNFVLIWVIFFLFLIMIHIIEYMRKQNHLGKKLDILLIVVYSLTLFLSVL